ncbi:MAG: Do family serine endopeptidase [Rhodobiaceae bacterium]|nr:Do family serine endopeptidase [Rhodobiaceae bacterium]MCC0054661.1 Do family serine endopeptidase [Rhodobiaceae bacterium]
MAFKSPRLKKVTALLLASAAIGGVAILAPQDARLPFTAPANAATLAPEQGFADLVEKVSPAVVSVIVSMKDDATSNDAMPGLDQIPEPFRRFFAPDGQVPRGKHTPQMAQGSGFFISADGYLVTNNHVVENAEKVTVRFDNGDEVQGKVVGTDKKTDLALVKIDRDKPVPYVNLSHKDARVGDWVVAVGNPFGLGGTVTAGIVSARGRDIGAGPYDDFIQIDASVNRGNSGGPAFDLDGNVIGVNTAIFSPSGGNVGIAFAIPASTVEKVVASLKEDGKVERGWLGVQIQPVTEGIAQGLGLEGDHGALVAKVLDDSPAAKTGLKVGDAIVSLNGEPVKDARDLVRRIGSMPPNQKVDLQVWRKGETKDITLELGTQPDDVKVASADTGDNGSATSGKAAPALGLSLADGQSFGTDGVVITEVDPDGQAADSGLQPGNIILQAGGKDVRSVADVDQAVNEARKLKRKAVLLLVAPEQGGNPRFIALPLKAA